jgi:hypothetical protein
MGLIEVVEGVKLFCKEAMHRSFHVLPNKPGNTKKPENVRYALTRQITLLKK